MATHFRREDVLCTIATHPCPWVPTEGFWSILRRRMSLLPVFLAVYVSPSLQFSGGGKVYVCKPYFAKLEKGCKTIHAFQQIVSDLCPYCMFLWWCQLHFLTLKGFTTSTVGCMKSLLKLSPQRSVPLSSQMLNWRTILHLRALQLVSKVCATILQSHWFLLHSGNRSKKLNLVHQTVFLVRGIVWARDYLKLGVPNYGPSFGQS